MVSFEKWHLERNGVEEKFPWRPQLLSLNQASRLILSIFLMDDSLWEHHLEEVSDSQHAWHTGLDALFNTLTIFKVARTVCENMFACLFFAGWFFKDTPPWNYWWIFRWIFGAFFGPFSLKRTSRKKSTEKSTKKSWCSRKLFWPKSTQKVLLTKVFGTPLASWTSTPSGHGCQSPSA